MLDAIGKIESFVGSMDLPAFTQSELVRSAVERQLLIVAEAARRLGADAESLFPGPNWRMIRGLGNVLRHEYDHVSIPRIWHVVQQDIPELKAFVAQTLTNLPDAT